MTKVLMYENRKCDLLLIDVSTPEKEAAGFLKLFQLLHTEWGVYKSSDLSDIEKKLFMGALDGNVDSAKLLLTRRRRYEYEEWYIVKVDNPLED